MTPTPSSFRSSYIYIVPLRATGPVPDNNKPARSSCPKTRTDVVQNWLKNEENRSFRKKSIGRIKNFWKILGDLSLGGRH